MKVLASALICALVIDCAGLWLEPYIAKAKQSAQQRAALGWLSPGFYDNNPLAATIALNEPQSLGLKQGHALLGYKNGQLSLIIVPVRSQGYVGSMTFEFALTPEGQLLATHFVRFNETPGIGDKVLPRYSDWLKLESHKTKNTYDHLVGATKTSTGLLKALEQAQAYVHKHASAWPHHEK